MGILGTVIIVSVVCIVRRKHSRLKRRDNHHPLEECEAEEEEGLLQANLSLEREIAQGMCAQVLQFVADDRSVNTFVLFMLAH